MKIAFDKPTNYITFSFLCFKRHNVSFYNEEINLNIFRHTKLTHFVQYDYFNPFKYRRTVILFH